MKSPVALSLLLAGCGVNEEKLSVASRLVQAIPTLEETCSIVAEPGYTVQETSDGYAVKAKQVFQVEEGQTDFGALHCLQGLRFSTPSDSLKEGCQPGWLYGYHRTETSSIGVEFSATLDCTPRLPESGE